MVSHGPHIDLWFAYGKYFAMKNRLKESTKGNFKMY